MVNVAEKSQALGPRGHKLKAQPTLLDTHEENGKELDSSCGLGLSYASKYASLLHHGHAKNHMAYIIGHKRVKLLIGFMRIN
jgi:hypothetical protein